LIKLKDADNAIEDTLHRLDHLSERELRAYNEQIRERTEAQYSLRNFFNIQQKEYEHAFKEQHFKMLNITHERDDLLRQVDVRNDVVCISYPNSTTDTTNRLFKHAKAASSSHKL